MIKHQKLQILREYILNKSIASQIFIIVNCKNKVNKNILHVLSKKKLKKNEN